MAQCGFAQNLKGLIVVYIMTAQNTTVTMRGIFTHAHIGNDIHFRRQFFDLADALLYDAISSPGTRTAFVLVRRQAEQNDTRHPVRTCTIDHTVQLIRAVMILTGQRRDLFIDICTFAYEDRPDQTIR